MYKKVAVMSEEDDFQQKQIKLMFRYVGKKAYELSIAALCLWIYPAHIVASCFLIMHFCYSQN